MAPPSNARVGDGRLVDGLRARRRGVAAQIYDVYGTRLFGYASGLLGDDDLAGRAVRAALLAARASPDSVPDPERLRAWLYALVRDECLSRLGDRPVDEEVPLEPGRLIFHYAVASSDDLVLESAHLTLRHGLGTRELAEVLGISAQQATDLKARLNAALAGPLKVPPAPTPTSPPPAPSVPEPEPPEAPEAVPVAARPRAPWVSGAIDHRRKKKKAGHRIRLGMSAGILVTAGLVMIIMFVVLSRSPEGATTERRPQAQGPVSDDDLDLPSEGASSPPPPEGSAQPTTPPSSAPVSPANSPPAKPGDPPPSKPPAKPPAKPPGGRTEPPPPSGGSPGRLSVSDGGCRGVVAPLSRRCSITLTAVGGTVRWAVASVNEGTAEVDASGSGTLASGRSTTVTVTIRPTVRCYASGFGSGSIGFAPGGSAGISYTCW